MERVFKRTRLVTVDVDDDGGGLGRVEVIVVTSDIFLKISDIKDCFPEGISKSSHQPRSMGCLLEKRIFPKSDRISL